MKFDLMENGTAVDTCPEVQPKQGEVFSIVNSLSYIALALMLLAVAVIKFLRFRRLKNELKTNSVDTSI